MRTLYTKMWISFFFSILFSILFQKKSSLKWPHIELYKRSKKSFLVSDSYLYDDDDHDDGDDCNEDKRNFFFLLLFSFIYHHMFCIFQWPKHNIHCVDRVDDNNNSILQTRTQHKWKYTEMDQKRQNDIIFFLSSSSLSSSWFHVFYFIISFAFFIIFFGMMMMIIYVMMKIWLTFYMVVFFVRVSVCVSLKVELKNN